MRKIEKALVVVVALIAIPAVAQSVPTPHTYTLTLSEQDVGVVYAALGGMSIKEGLATFNRIQAQVMEQAQAAAAQEATKATPTKPAVKDEEKQKK